MGIQPIFIFSHRDELQKWCDFLDRRSFLQQSLLLAAALAWGTGCTPPAAPPPTPWAGPDAPACRQPQNHEQATLLALAETIVPGIATDPQKTPGAVECCALELAYDEFFPTTQFAAVIVSLLDMKAQGSAQKPFVELSPAQREEVAEKTESDLSIITLAYRFFRAAFYNGEYNALGREWLRYPGPNTGYIHHRDFTQGKPVCREETPQGYLP